MSALALDPLYNDFLFTGGILQTVASNSIVETVQELNARFGFGKGEWFMDLQQGFPYLQAVLVKNPDVRAIAQLFRSMMLSTPGVASVASLTTNFLAASRILKWNAQIRHATGNYIAGGYGRPFVVQNAQAAAAL